MGYTEKVNGIEQKVRRALSAFGGKRFAVGVSGGRDSMCLLHVLTHTDIADKRNILAVHVNHNLRAEAGRDESFVRKYCEDNGIAFRAFSVDVTGESKRRGLSTEHAARELRYNVFYDLIKSGEADIILTAHHASDNAESALMHLFRGAGLDGMRVMSGVDTCAYDNACNEMRGVTVRPIADVYPSELDEYCARNGIKYVVDDTNFLDDADRNFIRLNVIPLIEQRYPGVVRAVNEFAAECAKTCAVLDNLLDDKYITYDRGAAVIKDEALESALGGRYVRRALATYFTTVDVTREQIDKVTELTKARTGAVSELSNGIKAAREYGGVALYLERPVCTAEIPVKTGANYIDGLAVDVLPSDEDPMSVRGGAVDGRKIVGAVLRFRRDGDMFTPFGGKRKKLKQYFIDAKIPKRLRDRIPLICRGSEVLVIAGLQISDEVKQTDKTADRCVVRVRGR